MRTLTLGETTLLASRSKRLAYKVEIQDEAAAWQDMGALSGRGSLLTECTREALGQYGDAIGLAFQIVDDLLDVEASTATLGKTAGKDAEQHKPTYVSLLGAQAARAWSLRLRAQALQAVDGIGNKAQRLRELADFVVCRKS